MNTKSHPYKFLTGMAAEEEEVKNGAFTSTWQRATDSILLDVFSFLDATSLCHAAQTCKTWNRVAFDKTLWRNLLRFSINDPDCLLPEGRYSWLKEYERIHFRAPLVLSETLTQHTDEVLHVSFAHRGHLFSTTSKDCTLKVWEVGYLTQLKFMKDFTDMHWGDTHFSCFNESDTMILVSGDNAEMADGSGFVAVLSLIHDFKLLQIIAVNSSQWFRSWLDDSTLLGEHLKKSQDGHTTKVEIEAFKIHDALPPVSEPFVGEYVDENVQFGHVLLTVSCGAASLIKFMKVANVPRYFTDVIPASTLECTECADAIPASICKCLQQVTSSDDNNTVKSTFSYSLVIDNDEARDCSIIETKEVSKGFFEEEIFTNLGQDAVDKCSDDSDNEIKFDFDYSMESYLISQSEVQTDPNPSDSEIKCGLLNERRDRDYQMIRQIKEIKEETIDCGISYNSEDQVGKGQTEPFSVKEENSIFSTNLKQLTSVENVIHASDGCSDRCNTSDCTDRYNTSDCTDRYNTSDCTNRYNTSDCTNRYNTSDCTDRYNTSDYTNRYNTSDCTNRYNTSDCTNRYNTLDYINRCNTSDCTDRYNTLDCTDRCNTSDCTDRYNTTDCTDRYKTSDCTNRYNTSDCKNRNNISDCTDRYNTSDCTVNPMQHCLDSVQHSCKTSPTCDCSKGKDKILIFVTGEFSGSLNRLCFKSLSDVIPENLSAQGSSGHDTNINHERDTDKLDHIIDLDGRVVGVGLSEDQRYIFINFRPWMDKIDRTEPRERPHLSPNVEVRVIDLLTFQDMGVKYIGHKGYFPSFLCCLVYLDVSPDYIASGSTNAEGYLWDRHYKCILGNLRHGPGVVNAVAFSPGNQECLVTVSDDNTIKIWRSKWLMKSFYKTRQCTHL